MATSDVTTIRTDIAAYLSANVDWIDEDNIADYIPTDAATVFGNLPFVIVDFDNRLQMEYVEADPGYLEGIPVLIEIYVESVKGEATGGRAASQDIAEKFKEIKNLFEFSPSINGRVKTSRINDGKVEGLLLEAIKFGGVLARIAWLSVITTL